MNQTTIIDSFYEDNRLLVSALEKSGEISLLNSVESHFRKSLVLCIASFFEMRIRESILAFVRAKSGGSEELFHFVRNKAIERQYHTYFNWKDGKNANTFLGLFGEEFKSKVTSELAAQSEIKQGMLAFLELGNTRNTLVHENFASFPIEKTASEIYDSYQQAQKFVQFLEEQLAQ